MPHTPAEKQRTREAEHFLKWASENEETTRAEAVAKIERRIRNLAGQLKMWRLTEQERTAVLAGLQAALDGTLPAKRGRRKRC